MHNWLANFVGNDRFNTYSIGHLGEVDTRRFWDERVITSAKKSDLQFEEVYEIAGGNMFLMSRLFLDYIIGGVHPHSFRIGAATTAARVGIVIQISVSLDAGTAQLIWVCTYFT